LLSEQRTSRQYGDLDAGPIDASAYAFAVRAPRCPPDPASRW
jgi:hypothetical protein